MIIGITMQQEVAPPLPGGDQEKAAAAAAEESNAENAFQASHSSQEFVPQRQQMQDAQQPPRQVYVSEVVEGMHGGLATGLENQFQALGIQEQRVYADIDHHDHSAVVAGDNGQVGYDETEEDNEAEPVKLFVGQIPKALGEEELFPTFDSFGPLKDVAVIRDKHSGLHRGCAFVTYWTAADAERAREALHDKFTFPGARRAAQVKPAEPSVPENKLFIGMLSRKAEEDEVRELFAPFGEIREIYMIRNADGTSKCAAFLRYVDREAAVQAIETLNSQVMMDGAARPLLVKFADNKHQKQQRQIRNVRRQELMVAMGPGGFPVYPPQGPPPMPMPGHGHPGPGPQYPMQPQPQYDPGPGGYPGHGAHHHPPPPHPYMYPPHQYGAPPPYAFQARQEAPVRQPNPRPREGPAGANLFVYHLPHDLTDADLATAFNPFGNVISAKVYVDKYTGESKGFGFVSYDSVISAESAIEQMNGFQIGNKRLKVQHKRVHISPSMGPQQHPSESPSPP